MRDDNNYNNDWQDDSSSAKMSSKSGRGFASMSKNKRREIASKGGRAAHKTGKAHEWNSREAKAAGRKGGRSRGSNQG